MTRSDDPGELEFHRKCSVCHTLTPDGKNRAGPTLYGLFGRRAGTVSGYEYSPALRNSGIVWSEETVSKLFDHGPDVVVPGTKMPIQRLKSVEHRDALIRFLKKATGPIE
ncbi:MAG TPA: c-type cytochrome [Hyphomicrobiales bacterium]|nr:c-type cytochrome [Hyphomicrobiales bacterium]